MAKVSVIVPVYNAEAFIEESANMILNQTLTEIEAIFVDDGSSDSSLEILKSLEAKDSRVKVLHQENINAGAARNFGLSYATGEYLSFLDADDLFDETMLEKAYNAASGSDIIVYGADNYLMDTGAYEPIEDAITDSENIFCRYKGWTWDKLFKSEFIKENNINTKVLDHLTKSKPFSDYQLTYDMIIEIFKITKDSLDEQFYKNNSICYLSLQNEIIIENIYNLIINNFCELLNSSYDGLCGKIDEILTNDTFSNIFLGEQFRRTYYYSLIPILDFLEEYYKLSEDLKFLNFKTDLLSSREKVINYIIKNTYFGRSADYIKLNSYKTNILQCNINLFKFLNLKKDKVLLGKQKRVNIISLNENIDSKISEIKEIYSEMVKVLDKKRVKDRQSYFVKFLKLKANLDGYMNTTEDNPHLMNNDITSSRSIRDPNFNMMDLRKAEYKAPEVVRNIKSTLKLSELNKSDQIAVVAEVMRQLAKELLDESKIPKTFANATAFSLIGHQYDKPEWTCNILARNLYIQNSKEYTDKLVTELQSPDLDKGGFIFDEYKRTIVLRQKYL
mgnify:CR=1 FL=1